MKQIERIQALSDAFGVSGFEDDVISTVQKMNLDHLELREDKMRNLFMIPKNNGKGLKIHLDAHSDEVGFIIQGIKPNGTLRFLPIGGWDPKNIVSCSVLIKTWNNEYVKGIVASKPPHFMNASDKGGNLDFSDLVIDIGATSKEEAVNDFGIHIGDPVVPDVKCEYDSKHQIFRGKAFDCRIGCAAVIEVLEELKDVKMNHEISATLSSQEEVGERGMKCVMDQMDCDLMICFEGCPADDTFSEDYMIQSGLKRGPMLRYFDVSMITSPRFMRYASMISEKYNIPMQTSVRKGGGTNGGISHLSGKGIPTIVIGVPTRYAHASIGYVSFEDYQNAVKLAKEIILNITQDDYEGF